MLSIICYASLFYLVNWESEGKMSTALQYMILAPIPFQIFNGIMLFFGALEEKVLPLEISLWLCLVIAAYNTLLGFIGSIYFIRTAYLTIHFLMAVLFALLACSLCSVIFHDILIVFAFKQLIAFIEEQPMSGTEPVVV